MEATTQKKTRKRGGQPGNRNAVTHGFYIRKLKPADLEGLEDCQKAGLGEEIKLLRTRMRKVMEMDGDPATRGEALDELRVVCLATISLTRMVRAQHYLDANSTEGWDVVKQALNEVWEEWGKDDPEVKKLY